MDRERIRLSLAVPEGNGGREVVVAGGQRDRQIETQRDAFLLADANGDLLFASGGPGQTQRPLALARNGLAGIVNDDELFFDRFAGKEGMVLAREVAGL